MKYRARKSKVKPANMNGHLKEVEEKKMNIGKREVVSEIQDAQNLQKVFKLKD